VASIVEKNEVLAELKEQTKWLRFLGLRALGPALETVLKSPAERRAYDFSDGSRSTRAVADQVGVSQRTVSNWWQRWASAGIVETDSTGRAKHLATLLSAGLEVPGVGREASANDG
jgi:DNA-binding transcriptional MocR family regulator